MINFPPLPPEEFSNDYFESSEEASIPLLAKIFSYLDTASKKAANRVSKAWNFSHRENEFTPLKQFLEHLTRTLGNHILVAQLTPIIEKIEKEMVNLPQFRLPSQIIKKIFYKETIEVLSSLRVEELRLLKESNARIVPAELRDIFDLANIHRQLEEARQLPDSAAKADWIRSLNLQLLTGDLMRLSVNEIESTEG